MSADEPVNLTSPKAVAALLAAHDIRPNKVLGQNFLIDRNILNHIVDAAELHPDVRVLEVGPGLGVLTEPLLANSQHVIAIEKDEGLHSILQTRWGDDPRLTLMLDDALDVDLCAIFAAGTTRLISNLPYSVGVRVVVDAACCETPPDIMVLLLQKEVGDRFTAKPGTADMGAVTIWLQQRYTVSRIRTVKPTCFHPRPEVMSAVIKLSRHDRFPLNSAERDKLRRLTKTAFLHRRKQLASAMRSATDGLAREAAHTREGLVACGAPETARPEDLSVEQWISLAAHW